MADCVIQSLPVGSMTGEFSPSGLKNGGLMTEVVINDTTWVALPTTPLLNRNAMNVENQSGVGMKVNYSAVVGYVGSAIGAGFSKFYEIKDSIIIYGKAAPGSGSVTILIEEIS